MALPTIFDSKQQVDMKRVLLIIWLIGTTVANTMSQITDGCVEKHEKQGKLLYLYMNPNEYKSLSGNSKMTLITEEATKHQVQAVYVVCDHEGELWQMADNSMKMIDSWDKDNATPFKVKKFFRSIEHPWFFNLSGAIGMSISPESKSNVISGTASGCGRIGCYLLKGRWDLALNGLVGYHFGDENNGSYSNSIGVDTRVYILKGKAINPFAGVGLAYAFGGGQSSFTIPISAGMSISVKRNGFIDLCYQYNNVTKSSFIIGYTYMHK